MRHFLWLAPLVLLCGCGLTLDAVIEQDANTPDGSTIDGSPGDAGAMDSGAGDSGAVDSGVPPDATVIGDGAPVGDATVCSTADLDLDGVSPCNGDCDDNDATVAPGLPEICGDARDNDCDRVQDEDCMGIGTYVATDGTTGAAGTQADPLRTVAEALVHAAEIGPGTSVYMAAGDYVETIRMTGTHSVLCGHDRDDWTRDIDAHETVVQAESIGHQFTTGTAAETRLDGCTLHGTGVGGSSLVVAFDRDAAGQLTNNQIVAADSANQWSAAVAVFPNALSSPDMLNSGVVPRIVDNQITLGNARVGDAITQGSYGVVVAGSEAVVQGNLVSMDPDGANDTVGILFFRTRPGSRIYNNTIQGADDAARARGIQVTSGSASIEQNSIAAPDAAGDSIGILLSGDGGTVTVHNNVSYGGNANIGISCGLLMRPTRTGSANIVVHSNFLAGGEGGRVRCGIGWDPDDSLTGDGLLGVVRSNILREGPGENGASAWRSPASGGPALFTHNALYGPYQAGPVTVPAAMTGTLNRPTDCGLSAPGIGGDHHLPPGSECIDRGTGEDGPADDFDLEARPPESSDYDIGPDER